MKREQHKKWRSGGEGEENVKRELKSDANWDKET